MTPKIVISPFGKGGAFSTWCKACGTLGYAYDRGCADLFKKRHERCAEGPRRGA